jgi:hypothetical protein
MTVSGTRRKRSGGAAIIEMTFVGIPLIFTLISIFEMSRGMWIYHTLAYSVKEGTRFAIVHGQNCVPVSGSAAVLNNCGTTEAGVAQVIQNAGVGLDLNNTMLTFCAPVGVCQAPCALNACATTLWPPASSNSVGFTIQIVIKTPFNSALAMFWPGSRAVSFSAVTLGASSTDQIQF